ncbi:MAG TPA: hypothetical protein VKE88_01395 [Candidatus Nanoarchaeia archaeon]|nr:hypothetical protein [Candidatus Nanoarchaeia archaeon]
MSIVEDIKKMQMLDFLVDIIMYVATFYVGWKYVIPENIKRQIRDGFKHLLAIVIFAQALGIIAATVIGSALDLLNTTGILGYPYKLLISIDSDREMLQTLFSFTYFIILSFYELLPQIRAAILAAQGKKYEDYKTKSLLELHKVAIKNLFSWKGFAYFLLVIGVLQTIFMLRIPALSPIAQYAFIQNWLNPSLIQNLNIGYWFLRGIIYMFSLVAGLIIGFTLGLIFTLFGRMVIGTLFEKIPGLGSVLSEYGQKAVGAGGSVFTSMVTTLVKSFIDGIGSAFISLAYFRLEPTLLTFYAVSEISIFSRIPSLSYISPALKFGLATLIFSNHERLVSFTKPISNLFSKVTGFMPGMEMIGVTSKAIPGKEKILLEEYKDYPHIETLISTLKHGSEDEKDAAMNAVFDLLATDKSIRRRMKLEDALRKDYNGITDTAQLFQRLIMDISKGGK